MPHTAIINGTILTMDQDRRIIDRGTLLIEDDRITAVGPSDTISVPSEAEIVDADGLAVLPGFVNAHTHAQQILLRGGASHDRGLQDWLLNVLHPGLAAYSQEDLRIGTLLYCVEALLGGITTIVSNEGASPTDFEWAAAPAMSAFETAGVRTIYARMYSDSVPSELSGLRDAIKAKEPGVQRLATSPETDQILGQLNELARKYHGRSGGLIHVWPAPISPYLVSKRGLAAASELARSNGTMWTMHLDEDAIEARVLWMSPTEYCRNLGALDARLLAAHCVNASARDIRLLKSHDVKVSTQPGSNAYLASGVAPVPLMHAHGLTVGIGTDDANCNDAVNMITEMKTLCLIHRAVNRDPSIITPEKALEMATIDGARAIGLESEIGSVEVGKRADISMLDCGVPQMTPHGDIAASIVFQANGSEVRDVMVGGRWRVRNRMPTFLSANELRLLLIDASNRAADIAKRAGISTTRPWRTVGI